MHNIVRRISPNGPMIQNRMVEIVAGSILALIGLCLLWDAFDGRGKKLPWPASGLAPW